MENRELGKSRTTPKKVFASIRSKNKIKSNIVPLTDEAGSVTQDSRQMARILYSTFASAFTVEDFETIPESLDPKSWDHAPGI